MDDLGEFDSSLLVKVGLLAAVGFGVWYLFLRKKAPALPASPQSFVPKADIVASIPQSVLPGPILPGPILPGPLQPVATTATPPGGRLTQDYVNTILQPTYAAAAAKAKAAGF